MDKLVFLFNHLGEIRKDVGGADGAFVVFDFRAHWSYVNILKYDLTNL